MSNPGGEVPIRGVPRVVGSSLRIPGPPARLRAAERAHVRGRRKEGREAWSHSRREQKQAGRQREGKERLCYEHQLMAQTLSLALINAPCDRMALPPGGKPQEEVSRHPRVGG